MRKKRADQILVDLNVVKTLDQAQRAIMAGTIYTIDEQIVRTAGEQYPESKILYQKSKDHPYVSRGGLKLAHALKEFSVDLEGKIVLDIGSSTGGFTDVSLRAGAKRVYALDVGTNQLAWKLRIDDRVTVMEQTNFRYSKPQDFIHGQPEFACTDVSFISLELIFPPLSKILPVNATAVVLIKPQFEVSADQVGQGGLITDPDLHEEAILKVMKSAAEYHFDLKDLLPSPIKGGKGNIEFLAHFKKVDHLVTDLDFNVIKETIKSSQSI